jgi:hypothetical protein
LVDQGVTKINPVREIKRPAIDRSEGKTLAFSREEARKIPWLWKDGMVGYAITQAFEGNKDIAYSGTLSAVKAALWLNKNSLWQSTEHRNHVISFPIVVTSSPLFECYLDEKGKSVLNPINHGFLFFNQYIKGFTGTCVSIVNESYIASFIEECNKVSKSMYKHLSPALEQEWNSF